MHDIFVHLSIKWLLKNHASPGMVFKVEDQLKEM
jgi:hypothetical protein